MALTPTTRARGANAIIAAAFNTTALAGTVPTTGYFGLPIVSSTLSEERALTESDLIGQGREMQDPTPDIATDTGDIVVPLDVRNFGRWLRLMFGAPTTTGTAALASGTITFSAQPADQSTITIGGVVFTFVAGTPTSIYQIKIGTQLDGTLANAAANINASSVAVSVDASRQLGTGVLALVADNGGPSGNAITLAAAATSNGTRSGATLTGGATASHVFQSGALALPDMVLEVGHPEIPGYFMHYGVRANTLKLTMQRSGNASATVSVIAQGEQAATTTTQANSAAALKISRFSAASGQITRDGSLLGNVISADLTLTNNLEAVETIQADGRIADSDPGMFAASLTLKMLFADLVLLNLATNGTPVGIALTWTRGDYSFTISIPRLFIPKPKRSITTPKGIQIDYAGQASGAAGTTAGGVSVTATLVNDVAAYA